MKRILTSGAMRRLGILALILATASVLAVQLYRHQKSAVSSPVAPLVLAAETKDATLAPFARVFSDADGTMNIQGVMQAYAAGGGDTPARDRLSLSHNAKAHWIVFTLKRDGHAPADWMLDLGRRTTGTTGVADKIAFFDVVRGESRLLMLDGRKVQNKLQMQGQDKNALPIDMSEDDLRTFVLRIEPSAGLPVSFTPRLMTVEARAALAEQVGTHVRMHKVFLLVLAGLSFALMLRRNSLTPAFFAAYVGAQFMMYRSADELVALGNNTGAVYLDLIAAGGAVAALLLTQRIFFPDPEQRGGLHRLLTTAMVAIALAAACSMGWPEAGAFATPFLLRLLPILLPAGIVLIGIAAALRQKYAGAAHVYTAAWLSLFIGAGLSAFVAGGYWVFFALHMVLLSFAALYFTFAHESNDRDRLLSALQREKRLTTDFNAAEERHRRELDESRAIAEAATKSRGEFLAIVSHEIRTPMTGIMGMIRLLMDTPLTDKQREYIDTLQYSCNALLALINDILDFSKVGAARMDIESIDFDLRRLTDGVIHLMKPRAEEKKIGLKAEIDPAVHRYFKGDPTRLRQILLNLIGNAIKFTDQGAVTLIVKTAGFDNANRQMVYFAVRDTGVGMTKEVLAKVFVPYAQGHASIARRYGGTGLGLSISQQLVNAMGGTVEATSEPGVGTTFFFTLALEEGQEESLNIAEDTTPAIPLRILIVDDNPVNQKVVLGLLEKDGHQMVAVGGGRAALDALAKADFDVILMDMEMPDIDGPAATRMIRALPDRKKASVPIVAMTSNTAPEDIKTCMDAGMNDHCRKPVDLPQLRAMLLQVAKKEGSFAGMGEPVTVAAAPPPVAPAPQPAPATPAPAEKPAVLFNPEILGTLKGSMTRAQMDDMMTGFYDKTEELIAAAEDAVAARDPKAISGRAHDIKGMTANFGLIALSEVAAKLSRQAKDGESDDTLQATVARLRPVYAETRRIVEDWIAS